MPSEWIDCLISDLAASTKNALVGGPFGSNLVSKDYVEFGIPVIRGQNMRHGRWIGGEFVFVSSEKARALSANTARPGDLVFTQRGTLGQVSVVPLGQFDHYIVSQSQMKLTVDSTKADVQFLYYFFSSAQQQEYISKNAVTTGVPHTNLDHLRKTPVLLPPLAEQRAIADILGSLDDKIELNRRMNATLEETARTLFKSWFVDFDPVYAKMEGREPVGMDAETAALFPDQLVESELGPIPEGWTVNPIGDLVRVVGGSTPRTDNDLFWQEGTIFWATPKDLSNVTDPILLETDRQITDLGLLEISSGLLPEGTVLLSSRAPIGYLVIAAIPVAINQGFIAMICDGVLPNYYVLNWTHQNLDNIKGRANGTTFMEISKKNFRPILAIVPSATVLDCFVDIVTPIYEAITENMRNALTLAATRDALLPKLLSGEVQVIGLEPYSDER